MKYIRTPCIGYHNMMRMMFVLLFSFSFIITTEGQIQLTQTIVEQALEVAKIGQDLYENTNLYPSSTIYEHGPDEVMIYKNNNQCYVVFRGTDFTDPDDALTNIDLFSETIQSSGGVSCTVHGGFKDALLDPNYFNNFHQEINNCYNSCGNNNKCEVILGGHSQGGGVASIAAIYYDYMNPTVITLGKVSAIYSQSSSGCSALNPSKTFHFQNTKLDHGYISGGPYTYYDFAPRLFWGMDWTGNEYLIGPNQPGVIAYSDGNRPSNDWKTAWAATAHPVATYISSLELLLSRNDFSMNGWNNDTPCQENSECSSNYCSHSAGYRCKRKLNNGETCWSNDACKSGNCKFSWFRWICK